MPIESINPSQQAESILLAQIQSGKLPSGCRLPPTATLANELGLGVNSVQKALGRLATLGYLERRTRMGTFVRRQEKKPMNVFVLIGPDLKKDRHYRDRFLAGCLERELTEAGYIPHLYSNLTGVLTEGGEARVRLVERLKEDFVRYNPVGLLESSAVFRRFHELSLEFNRPMVSIKSPHMGGDLNDDRHYYMLRCLHRLAELGCKRLLWVNKITGTSPDSIRVNTFWNAIQKSNITCVDVIEVNDQDPLRDPEVVVQNRIKEFIIRNRQLPAAKRIDSLLVDEDILMRGVALALLSEQVRIPEELTICTSANEGVDINFGIPVIAFRSGISELAREAINLLTARILRKDGITTPILIKGGGPDFEVPAVV